MTLAELLEQPLLAAQRLTYLVDVVPTSPGGAAETLRWSTRAYASHATDTPAHTPWDRRLLAPPATTHSIWAPDALGAGSTLPQAGSFQARNGDGGLDAYRPYSWPRAGVTVRAGDVEAPLADFEVVFEGQVQGASFGLDAVTLTIAGLEARFDVPAAGGLYRGTGLCLHLASGASASLGTPAALNLTGSLTVRGSVFHDGGGSTENIFGWQGGSRYPWHVRKGAGDKIVFLYTHSTGTAASQAMSAGIVAGEWYTVAAIVSGSSLTFVLYRWSTGEETVETYTLAVSTRDANSGSTLRFGTSGSGLVGYLDEWAVSNVALTLNQLRDERFGPRSSIPASVVGLWHFDGDANDSSASAAHATTSGTVDWVASCTGADDLAGTTVPEMYGPYYHQEPYLLDGASQLYQLACGPLQSLTPYEGGVSTTLDTGGEHTNRLTFLKTAAAAGKMTRYLAGGMFKLGTPPVKPLTCSGEGHNAGIYVNQVGTITRRLITTRGPRLTDPDNLDTASFTAFASAAAQVVGIAIRKPETLRSVLDRLHRSTGSRWGYQRGSSLFEVRAITGPAGSADHDLVKLHILAAGDQPEPLSFGRVIVYWKPFGRALRPEEISSGASSTTREQLQQPWRQVEILGDDPAAPPLEVYTGLDTRADAHTEGRRLLDLFDASRLHEITLDRLGDLVKDAETVSITYLDTAGNARLGYDGSGRYLVNVVESDPAAGTVRLVLLGDD